MLRISLATTISSLATSAIAHPGHIEAAAGHSHYVVLGAIVVAAAIAVLVFRNKKFVGNV